MCHSNARASLTVLKSHVTLVTFLCVACLTTGCNQVNALREQQLTIQKNVDFNTEMMASLLTEMELQQQDMDSALDSIQKKQRDLQGRQDNLQQYVDNVSTNIEDMTNQVQILSQEFSDFSNTFDKNQQVLAANYDDLSDAQSTLQEVVYDLQESRDTMQTELVSLETEQIIISTLARENKEEFQEFSTSSDQETITTVATLIQEDVKQLAANLQSMQIYQTKNDRAVSEHSAALLRNMNELQANYLQSQNRLDFLQQEIGLMRDSTTTLDSKVTLLLGVTEED
ncbi:hypothetical protein ACFL6U_09065 [Planctomycetota bacterium]